MPNYGKRCECLELHTQNTVPGPRRVADTKVAIFRLKKLFLGIRNRTWTDGSFVRIPPVSRKRKTSEFRYEPFLCREKPSEFRSEPFSDDKKPWNSIPTIFGREKTSDFHSEPFLEIEKKFRILFRTNFWNRKRSKISSKPFLGTEKTCKNTSFVSGFVKLLYFVELHFVPSCSDCKIDSFEKHRIPQNEHFFPWNNKNHFKSIPRNFFGMKFWWQSSRRRRYNKSVDVKSVGEE